MELGLYVHNSGPLASPAVIRDLAAEAERRGYDGVWTNEHVMPAHELDYSWPIKDSYIPSYAIQSTLAYLAGITRRVRLGSSVQVLPFHQTYDLARAIATLDQLSDGRAVVGVAAGWNAQEMAYLGFDFADRGPFTDEALEVMRRLWTEPAPRFEGRWHRFGPVDFEPEPRQRPHPPIWIGGNGAPSQRRVVQFGAGWLISYRPAAWIAEHVARVRKRLARAGRSPDDVAFGMYYNLPLLRDGARIDSVRDARHAAAGNWLEGPVDAVVEDLRRFVAAGLTYPIVRLYAEEPDDLFAQLRLFDEEVRPAIVTAHTVAEPVAARA